MKHLNKLCICFLALMAMLFIGCSTTRKTVQSSSEQHLTSSTKEDRHTESQTGEAANINQNVNTLTNAVIEFTKTEYFDGTVKVDTTGYPADNTAGRPHDRESKDPPNNSGIKSITNGRIELNSEKNESTNIDIKRESESKSDESLSEESTEDNTEEATSEEKPKRGFIYYLGIIIGALFTGYAIYCIVYGVWRIRKQLKNRLPK